MEQKQSTPSFYAVIPATVRYDDSIPASAKLLYAEIAALSGKEGYCWANNRYFAGLYKTSTRSIQSWLEQLKDAAYIFIDIDSASGNTRKIFIEQGNEKIFMGVTKKTSLGNEENFTHSNKTNNKESISSVEDAENTTLKTEEATQITQIYHLYLKSFKVPDYASLTNEQRVIELTNAEKRYRLTDKRRDAIRRRLRDAGFQMVGAAILGYAAEPWYQGENDRQWTADLEKFICRNYEKIEEGANKHVASKKQRKTNDPWEQ